MMRHLLVLAAAISLCACSPSPETETSEAPSIPPPALPAKPDAFAGDINALGTEPFWAVEVRETTLKFSRPGEADFVAPNPQPKVEGDTASWSSNGLSLTLTATSCSDGMSDRTYPWKAEAVYGGATLIGCAIKAEDLANAPRP